MTPSDSRWPRCFHCAMIMATQIPLHRRIRRMGVSSGSKHGKRQGFTKTTHRDERIRMGNGILEGDLAPQLCFPVSSPAQQHQGQQTGGVSSPAVAPACSLTWRRSRTKWFSVSWLAKRRWPWARSWAPTRWAARATWRCAIMVVAIGGRGRCQFEVVCGVCAECGKLVVPASRRDG